MKPKSWQVLFVFITLLALTFSSLGLNPALAKPLLATGDFLLKWGSNGSEDGQFNSPWSLAVDSAGNVYVADQGNHRIQVFDSAGTYLRQWGSQGSGDGQFNNPYGVAVDSAGNVYVADSYNHRIQVFDSSGTYLRQWGSRGSGDGQFDGAYGVAVDSAGNVYVADTYNDRIQVFDSSGAFLRKWGSSGSADGQFSAPISVAVDGAGNVYVADAYNHRIQVFDSSGTFLRKWGSNGSADGQFQYAYGVAVDGAGNVYVADILNQRIQVFDSAGSYLGQWGTAGSGDGQFQYPVAVAADNAGNIYVSDLYNYRIQKFEGYAAPAPHTVTFDANSGSGTMSNQTAIGSNPLTANAFTRAGYSFAGWNTAANGSGTAYADGATYNFSADITLYAQWVRGTACVTTTSSGTLSGAAFGFGHSEDERERFQTFVFPNTPGLALSGVQVLIQKAFGSGQSDVTVELYATSGDLPTGSPLASATIPASSVGAPLTTVTARLGAAGLMLTPNAKYAIVLGQVTPQEARYQWATVYDIPGVEFGKNQFGSAWVDESGLGDGWLKGFCVPAPIVSGSLGANGAGGTVTYTGGSTTADGSGNYSFVVPSIGWMGTITPSKVDTYFTPALIDVTTPVTADLPNQNFTTVSRAFGKSIPANGLSGVYSTYLHWVPSAGATGYEYCLDTSSHALGDTSCPGGWLTASAFAAGEGLALNPGTLTVGTTYYWQIRSILEGQYTYPNGGTWWQFSTMPGVFGKLGPANTASGVSTAPTLTWSASANATRYEYCLDTSSHAAGDASCPGAGWQNTTLTSAGLSELSASTTYYWQVRALYDGAYRYGPSAWWSFTTASAGPAGFGKTSPADLGYAASTTPTISWGTSGGALSYQYCLTTTGAACDTGWVSTGSAMSQALSLSGNTTYYWQARAVNTGGTTEADSGSWWSFTTPAGPFAKTSPVNGRSGVYSTYLHWLASSGATGYEYCLDTTSHALGDTACPGGWLTAVSFPSGSGLAYNPGVLQVGTTYYWQLRSVAGAQTTYADGGTWWNFSTMSGAFGKTFPAKNASGVGAAPTLSWGVSTGATSYEYCYTTTAGGICDTGWVSTTSTSAPLSELTVGTPYYWQVRAVYAGAYRNAAGGWWSFVP